MRIYFVSKKQSFKKGELVRLDYRMKWQEAFKAFLKELDSKKPVILCGDLNVAHKKLDLKNSQSK